MILVLKTLVLVCFLSFSVTVSSLQFKNAHTFKLQFSKTQTDEGAEMRRKPIVLVPGILGSQLIAKFNKPNVIRGCKKVSDWSIIWLNPRQLIGSSIHCWADNIKLTYDNSSKFITNSSGVQVKVPNFGTTKPFEYLSNKSHPLFEYFAPLVRFLTEEVKYLHGVDLFGAAFDWRLSPRLHDELFYDLEKLIEKAFHINNRKVVVLAHSMGGPFVNFFLNKQSDAWKKKYIDSFVSISSSFYGATKSLKAVISGDTEGYDWLINSTVMRDVGRTLPSFLTMIPRPKNWPADKSTIVVTPERNFTVFDYQALFKRIGCKYCWDMIKEYGWSSYDIDPPNVPVHCIFSTSIPTFDTLVYDDTFGNSELRYIYGDGDGTINTWSSSACLKWRSQQRETVFGLKLPKNNHIEILGNATLHNYLKKILTL